MESCSGALSCFLSKNISALIYLTARFLSTTTPYLASVALPNSSDKKIRRKQISQQLGTQTNMETVAAAVILILLGGNAYAQKFSRR